MENLTSLLDQLSQKLGTTTEYLWSLLLRQASISAIEDLIFLIMTIIGGIIIFNIYKKMLKDDQYAEITLQMIVVFVVWFVLLLMSLTNISNIINGLFNPEYWALKEILYSIGRY